jgi:hypothetical protein
MTGLHKSSTRRRRAPRSLPPPHRRQLGPGDVLAMRLERPRTRYHAPLADVFRLLAQWHAAAAARRKREERKARKVGAVR